MTMFDISFEVVQSPSPFPKHNLTLTSHCHCEDGQVLCGSFSIGPEYGKRELQAGKAHPKKGRLADGLGPKPSVPCNSPLRSEVDMERNTMTGEYCSLCHGPHINIMDGLDEDTTRL